MDERFPGVALIGLSLLVSFLVFKLTGSVLFSLCSVVVYPCLGAVVIRICEWLRFLAAPGLQYLRCYEGGDRHVWTQAQRVLLGSVWPATFLVSLIYYGFLIIIRVLY